MNFYERKHSTTFSLLVILIAFCYFFLKMVPDVNRDWQYFGATPVLNVPANAIKKLKQITSSVINESYKQIPGNFSENVFPNISSTRKKVRAEIQDYLSFLHKNETQLIPELGGTPIRCMLATTWRSGSTFLGETLAIHPGAFYYYEPLWLRLRIHRAREEDQQTITFLKNMLLCAFNAAKKRRRFKSDVRMVRPNKINWFGKNKVDSVREISSYCKLYPVQIIKILRLGSPLLKAMLHDTSLNIRVLLWVRDPRALLLSRTRVGFCTGRKECIDPRIVCKDQYDDYKVLKELKPLFPERIMGIRFEDITANPLKIIPKIYEFCGLQSTTSLIEYLKLHTNPDTENIQKHGSYGTFRNASEVSVEWKKKLKWSEINRIQTACGEAMAAWGYKKVERNNIMNVNTY